MAVIKKKRKLGAGGASRGGAKEVSTLRPRWAPKTPPCVEACPNGNDVRGCLTAIALAEPSGRTYAESVEKAWYLLTNTNPLPSTCGRVCPHLCQGECNRGGCRRALTTTCNRSPEPRRRNASGSPGNYMMKHCRT
ncbi:hypothetical protein ACFLWB_02685 [Chloroflexota bacterium]